MRATRMHDASCDEQEKGRCHGAQESPRRLRPGALPRLQRSDHRCVDFTGWALRVSPQVLAADRVSRQVQLTDPPREATHDDGRGVDVIELVGATNQSLAIVLKTIERTLDWSGWRGVCRPCAPARSPSRRRWCRARSSPARAGWDRRGSARERNRGPSIGDDVAWACPPRAQALVAITILPCVSRRARQPGGTRVVASYSSISRGPGRERLPSGRARSRAWRAIRAPARNRPDAPRAPRAPRRRAAWRAAARRPAPGRSASG